MSVERGVSPRNDRPGVRVGGSFAGEVSGVELLEGGVDVVEIERDERRDPFAGVDLDDVSISLPILRRGRDSGREGEALPTYGDGV